LYLPVECSHNNNYVVFLLYINVSKMKNSTSIRLNMNTSISLNLTIQYSKTLRLGELAALGVEIQSQAIPVVTGVFVKDSSMPERVQAADMPASSGMAIGQEIAEVAITSALEQAAEEGREIVL
jgi:hypothetical protein